MTVGRFGKLLTVQKYWILGRFKYVSEWAAIRPEPEFNNRCLGERLGDSSPTHVRHRSDCRCRNNRFQGVHWSASPRWVAFPYGMRVSKAGQQIGAFRESSILAALFREIFNAAVRRVFEVSVSAIFRSVMVISATSLNLGWAGYSLMGDEFDEKFVRPFRDFRRRFSFGLRDYLRTWPARRSCHGCASSQPSGRPGIPTG